MTKTQIKGGGVLKNTMPFSEAIAKNNDWETPIPSTKCWTEIHPDNKMLLNFKCLLQQERTKHGSRTSTIKKKKKKEKERERENERQRDASRCVGRAAMLRIVCSQVKRPSYLLACFVGLLAHQSRRWWDSRDKSTVSRQLLPETPPVTARVTITGIHPDRHRATNNKKPDLKLFVTPRPRQSQRLQVRATSPGWSLSS